jgi:hypothetical protein
MLGFLTANAKIHVKPKKVKAKALPQNCYGGMGTCGATYMFCVDATLTSAQQLNIWDAFDHQYCPVHQL